MNKFSRLVLDLLSLGVGCLLPLAFAPYKLYWLAFLCPLVLLIVWEKATPWRAFFRGWLFGLGLFGLGVYWVFISIHVYGNASIFLAGFITTLLIFYLALFPGFQGYFLNRFFSKSKLITYLFVFPASWVLFEWIRSWMLTGFPWLSIGYSQIDFILRSLAPIAGVYGVSFFTILFSSILFVFFKGILYAKPKWFFSSLALLLIIITICLSLLRINWTIPVDGSIKVSLIQGNIPQEQKWKTLQMPIILAKYHDLTKNHWDSKIIIWPEAALPEFSWQVQSYLDKLDREAKYHNSTIILGAPVERRLTGEYYNAMLAVGENESLYLKRHLVPFGEYPIFGGVTKFILRYMNIPLSFFTAGDKMQKDFLAANIVIAPSICFEVAFPGEVADFLPKAQLLVNISDDSWFDGSNAGIQQLEIAQMRALETGRYYLVVTNTGVTSIINPNGTLQSVAPANQPYVLNGYIYPMAGSTPWVRWGQYIWLSLVILGLLFSYFSAKGSKPK